MMILITGLVTGLVVFAIAAVVIGREARRLDSVPPLPTVDVEEATAWIAERLPPQATAELSYGDVRDVIGWALEYLHQQAASGTAGEFVVDAAAASRYVSERAWAAGREVASDLVHEVVTAYLQYLEAIGAVGPEARPGEL